jgi:hypothetical protein
MFLKRKLQDDLFPVPVPFIVSAFIDLPIYGSFKISLWIF